MEKLILWEMNRSFTPADPGERMKLQMTLCELVKADMKTAYILIGASIRALEMASLSPTKMRKPSLRPSQNLSPMSNLRLNPCFPLMR